MPVVCFCGVILTVFCYGTLVMLEDRPPFVSQQFGKAEAVVFLKEQTCRSLRFFAQ
jgi:hypothetical protein